MVLRLRAIVAVTLSRWLRAAASDRRALALNETETVRRAPAASENRARPTVTVRVTALR